MTAVTPEGIQDVAQAIDTAADSKAVEVVEEAVKSHLPKAARAAIYETSKWAGVAGAVGGTVAASLDGTPALYVAAVAALLLAINAFVAKAHLTD